MRSRCHICGGSFRVTKKGKLYKHTRVMGAGKLGWEHVPFKVEGCPGSGHEPMVILR